MTAEAQEGISQMPPLIPVDIPDEEVSPIYDVTGEEPVEDDDEGEGS